MIFLRTFSQFIIGCALGLMLILPVQAFAQTPIWASEALALLIKEGVANNQSLTAMQYEVNALTDQSAAAGTLPDPRLGIGMLNLPTDTFRLDQEPMTQKQIFIAQKIPWAGKRSLRSEGVKWSADQKEWMLENKRLTLSKDIAQAWYDLGFINKSLEINTRLTDLVKSILRAAESRYATGRGLQQNIFQAQVELSKLNDEHISLKTKYRSMEDRINTLLNRKAFHPVTFTNDLNDPEIRLSLPGLRSTALTHNPELKAAQSAINQADTRIQLAKKDYWPDVDIKAAYGQREESKDGQDRADFVSTTISINLPIWQHSKQDKKLAAATAMHQSSVQSYENLTESIKHRLDSLATEIINLQDNYHLYKASLLPQARDWARSALDAYEVGKVEFDTMINARMRVLMFERQMERYRLDVFKKRAELEALIGQPLP